MEAICVFKTSPYVSKESMKELMEANVIVIIDGSQYSNANLTSSIIIVPPKYMKKLQDIKCSDVFIGDFKKFFTYYHFPKELKFE
jgi:hypothetical protein